MIKFPGTVPGRKPAPGYSPRGLAAHPAARWRVWRWRDGSEPAARFTSRAPARLQGDAGQVGRGWRVPERWAAGRWEESSGTVVLAGGEGAPVVVVKCGEVLQLGRGKR
jgi:hypothetical protein